MRFRLGVITGLATGYYLGARAGRQRYEQINRALSKLRGSDTFETATERARTVVNEGVDKASSLVGAEADDAGPSYDAADAFGTAAGTAADIAPTAAEMVAGSVAANGSAPEDTVAIIVPTPGEPPSEAEGYSSSR